MSLQEISLQQAAAMRKIYAVQEAKIKAKLLKAIEKGNDTAYLKKLLASIQDDIKLLDAYYKNFSQLRLGLIYKEQAKEVDLKVRAFDNHFEINSTLNANRIGQNSIKILAENTYMSLNSVSTIIGRRSEDLIREIGLKQAQGIVFGSETWQQVAKSMTEELKANNFFSINYKLKNGKIRQVPARVYSEMVARTTSAEAFRQGTHDRISDWGYDLVDVVGTSSYPNSPCIPFEGTTLSLSGKTYGYVSYDEAVAAGFNHPNCVHSTVFSNKNIELIE